MSEGENTPNEKPDPDSNRAASHKSESRTEKNDDSSSKEEHEQSQPQPEPLPLAIGTTNMEVHKHPHGVTHKKKWGEYLLEFFMIFFAVMLGFLAENLREHTVDRKKAKAFVESMVDDLKKDTANFEGTYLVNQITLEKMDSLIFMLRATEYNNHTAQLYYLARLVAGISQPYFSTDRTFNQMRSSGNLRLIENHAVADSVTSYYYKIERLKFQTDLWLTVHRDFREKIAVVFDGAVFQEMYKQFRQAPQYIPLANGRRILDASKPSGNPALANESTAAIKSLIASAHFLYSNTYGMDYNALNAKSSAVNLIAFLQDHYHLKK